MVRTIVVPQNNMLSISVPDSLVGKKVEVIAFALEDAEPQPETNGKQKPSQMRGFLSKQTAEAMQQHITQSRTEWDTL